MVQTIIKSLRFIKEPELNIFLYAPVEIIEQRKQELDAVAIQLLTEGYLNLFDNLERLSKKKYLCVENIDLSDTNFKIDEYLRKISLV